MGIIRYIKSYILIFMLIPYFSCFSVYGQHDKGHYYILKKYSIENKSKLKPILDTVINQLKSSSEARYIKNGFDINVVNANDSIVILQIEALTEKYWIIDKNTSFFAYKKCLFFFRENELVHYVAQYLQPTKKVRQFVSFQKQGITDRQCINGQISEKYISEISSESPTSEIDFKAIENEIMPKYVKLDMLPTEGPTWMLACTQKQITFIVDIDSTGNSKINNKHYERLLPVIFGK